jgi:hypothetical protein
MKIITKFYKGEVALQGSLHNIEHLFIFLRTISSYEKKEHNYYIVVNDAIVGVDFTTLKVESSSQALEELDV